MGEQENPSDSRVARRTFIKALSAGTLTGTSVLGLSGNVQAASQPQPGASLEGKTVFKGPNVDLSLSDVAATTYEATQAEGEISSHSSFDVGIFAPDSPVTKRERRAFIDSDVPVFHLGGGAEEAAASVLYDLSTDQVTATTVDQATPSVNRSVGMEYDPNLPSYNSAILPVDGKPNSASSTIVRKARQVRRGPGVTDSLQQQPVIPAEGQSVAQRQLEQIDKALGRSPKFSTQSDVSTQDKDKENDGDSWEDPDYDGSLETMGDDWIDLGMDDDELEFQATYEGTTMTAGTSVKKVVGGKLSPEADETEPYDYWGWQVQLDMDGNDELAAEARNMWRDFQINDPSSEVDTDIERYGPHQTENTVTKSTSIGFGVNSGGIGASASWGWSTTSADVDVTPNYYDSRDGMEHHWDIKSGARDGVVNAGPGYTVQVEPGTDSVSYDAETEWEFHFGFDWNVNYTQAAYGSWDTADQY